MACSNSVTIGNFTITFVGETALADDIVRWCWDIEFTGTEGPALSHWDIQTCPFLGLDQLERVQIIDVTDPDNPVILVDTTNPTFVEFGNGFPDGFPVYGMKTNLPEDIPELGPGLTYRFCYDFDESEVSLTPVAGFAATKSGAGQAADEIVFGLCSPGCDNGGNGRGRGICP